MVFFSLSAAKLVKKNEICKFYPYFFAKLNIFLYLCTQIRTDYEKSIVFCADSAGVGQL